MNTKFSRLYRGNLRQHPAGVRYWAAGTASRLDVGLRCLREEEPEQFLIFRSSTKRDGADSRFSMLRSLRFRCVRIQ
jgi:hypothetical protein